MKLVAFVVAFLVSSFVNAQTPITSQNILTPTVGAWTGSVAGQNGGFSGGGNGPAFNSTTNTLIFGYSTATATQRITAEAFAIQHALDLSNSGIKINGYNYSWQINNSGDQSGTLTGKVELMRGNTALQSYSYNYDTPTNGFELKTGTQTFVTEQSLLAADTINLSFTGKDNRFWAGYYGPQVRNPSLTLNYTTDPCMGNPLYSPSCPDYNQVLTSQTIFAQQYAINQALSLSGSGVKINGFEYGYNYYVGGDWCSETFLGIFCTRTSASSMAVDVNVTSNTGSSLYSATHNHGSNTSGEPSYSYVFPQQRLLSSMGNFSLSTREVGTTALYSSWSRWQYTPDPCVSNPLSSPTCDGYQAAYQTQMCVANALYNPTCPGYAAALFTQQCSANPLTDVACPGYASAYLTYQCTINPLYSTTCVGYETAYFDQQCSINPLYNSRCSGYAAAYKTQQCSINALYDVTCDGYASAYKTQQCSLNSLYATDCPGYAAAYKTQQCSINALYATDCPGYAAAFKTQQCTASPLYATDCPGYAEAYFNQQCRIDSLYNNKCEGYATAYAIKYLTPISSDSTVANAVNGSLSDTAAVKANDPSNTKVAVAQVSTTVNTDGSVSTGVSATGDTNVDKAIASKTTSTGGSQPAAAVQLTAPPPAAPMAQRQDNKQEEKKSDNKPEGGQDKPSGGPQQTQNADSGNSKPAAPTVRQELQARREAAAKAEAVEKGKNLANEMGKATDMESQKAVQNVVIQAMGFTPGFDAYGKTMLPDVVGYKPFTVYSNQRNVENRNTLRMFGGTDRLHNEMIESQYKR